MVANVVPFVGVTLKVFVVAAVLDAASVTCSRTVYEPVALTVSVGAAAVVLEKLAAPFAESGWLVTDHAKVSGWTPELPLPFSDTVAVLAAPVPGFPPEKARAAGLTPPFATMFATTGVPLPTVIACVTLLEPMFEAVTWTE